jgi:hypothetical protein
MGSNVNKNNEDMIGSGRKIKKNRIGVSVK